MHYNMLQKSELKITHIRLNNTNLHQIAECVADIYGVAREKVLVIDVRNEEVALDILDDNIDPHCFMAKEKELLDRIARIPGVSLQNNSRVTSDGMLGWIAFSASREQVEESLAETERLTKEVSENIGRRVIVFPSGAEVESGEIEDTNTPMLQRALTEKGYFVEKGIVLKDDFYHITNQMYKAVEKGFGTIITTGGVGAEDKDHSVEAVLSLDPNASTPYIAKFQKNHGRHVKDGIRIAVGEVEGVRIITLPGPNDEVALCLPALLEGMQNKYPKQVLAEQLAGILRANLLKKCGHHINTMSEEE